MQAKFCIKDWCCNYANKKEQTTIYWNTARVSDITSMEIQKTEIKQTIANRRYTIISVGSGTLKGFRVSIFQISKNPEKTGIYDMCMQIAGENIPTRLFLRSATIIITCYDI